MPTAHCPHCSAAVDNDGSRSGQMVACLRCATQFPMPAICELVPVRPGVECPHCRRRSTYDARSAGRRVVCPDCGRPFELPRERGGGEEAAASPEPTTTRRETYVYDAGGGSSPRSQPGSSGNRGNGMVALLIGLVAVLFLPLLGPVAIYVAYKALREDRTDGAARGGLILGWFSTLMVVLGCCLVAGLLGVSAVAVDKVRQRLHRHDPVQQAPQEAEQPDEAAPPPGKP